MVNIPGLFKSPTFLLKLVELVFSAICTALVAGDIAVAWNLHKMAVIYVTIIGYMMISIIVLLGYFLDTPLNKLILIAIGGSGCIMFITAGALMCETYSKQGSYQQGRLIGSGILALINAAIYGVDTLLTFISSAS